jgi:hypothetical protein
MEEEEEGAGAAAAEDGRVFRSALLRGRNGAGRG